MVPVLIPLFVSAFRRADELADALDARCYSASPKRTKMKVLRFHWRDLVGLLVVAGLMTLILLDKYLVGGEGLVAGVDRYVWAWIKSWFA